MAPYYSDGPTLPAMASTLLAMASTLPLAMASTVVAMASTIATCRRGPPTAQLVGKGLSVRDGKRNIQRAQNTRRATKCQPLAGKEHKPGSAEHVKAKEECHTQKWLDQQRWHIGRRIHSKQQAYAPKQRCYGLPWMVCALEWKRTEVVMTLDLNHFINVTATCSSSSPTDLRSNTISINWLNSCETSCETSEILLIVEAGLNLPHNPPAVLRHVPGFTTREACFHWALL